MLGNSDPLSLIRLTATCAKTGKARGVVFNAQGGEERKKKKKRDDKMETKTALNASTSLGYSLS